MSVNDANIAYNTGVYQPISSKVIGVPIGAKTGVMWVMSSVVYRLQTTQITKLRRVIKAR